MRKLQALPARITAPPNRIGPADTTERSLDRYRAQATPWRAWYGLRRWADLRMRVFTRDLFTCQRCGKIEADTSQLVCDHIVRHDGAQDLFWSEKNCQTLCAPCHNSAKQREEQADRIGSKRAR